jgi:hypothetical protein
MTPNVNTLKLNPNNPRTISKIKYEKLKKSLHEFVKMLEIRPIAYDEEGIIWGGNMRFRALKDLVNEGLLEDKPEYYKELTGFTLEEKRRFAIEGNVEFGDWDMDMLGNEWDDLPLDEWGVLPATWGAEAVDVNELWEQNGMPDYGDPSSKKPFRSVMVHFQTQDDVNRFAELLMQTITEKTKFLWYPRKNEV